VLQDNADKSQLHEAEKAPVKTVLYAQHIELTDKSHIAAFGGYLMPLWYSSIAAEHAAVREAAGVFDCTHMGLLEISGVGAAGFMDQLTTNSITKLKTGYAQYSFILDTSGAVLDDVIVFRKDRDEFIVVVNAANNIKIKNWIDALVANEVRIDPDNPGRKVATGAKMRDLRGGDCGDDCRVDIALQGPKSPEVLSVLIRDEEARSQIVNLRQFEFAETVIEGVGCMVSHTGYTGASSGFEFFVHPEKAPRLWEAILRAGKPLGLLPCGLGSRDSLRIEAGFPLYGHELAGKFNISPFEAGYGWAVKLEKEFFVGKKAMERASRDEQMRVLRIELPGTKGIRPVRPDDAVLDKSGRSLGWVLSCARAGEKQIALVYVDTESVQAGETIGLCYAARSPGQVRQGRKQSIEKGELLEADLSGRAVERFAKF
jgi:glycine hydroxymethyltransferase